MKFLGNLFFCLNSNSSGKTFFVIKLLKKVTYPNCGQDEKLLWLSPLSYNTIKSSPEQSLWALLGQPGCKHQSPSEWAPLRASKPSSLLHVEDHWTSTGWADAWADTIHSSRVSPLPVKKMQRHLMWVLHWIQGEFFLGIPCTCSFRSECVWMWICCSKFIVNIALLDS